MSPNTRSRALSPAAPRAGLVALAALALCALTPLAQATAERAPPLPPDVTRLAPGLRAQGGGLLTWLGLSVYDGWYWTAARGWPDAGPYALDLHYHRDLVGARIAERSAIFIARRKAIRSSSCNATDSASACAEPSGFATSIILTSSGFVTMVRSVAFKASIFFPCWPMTRPGFVLCSFT